MATRLVATAPTATHLAAFTAEPSTADVWGGAVTDTGVGVPTDTEGLALAALALAAWVATDTEGLALGAWVLAALVLAALVLAALVLAGLGEVDRRGRVGPRRSWLRLADCSARQPNN
jgi:hypothetical protein